MTGGLQLIDEFSLYGGFRALKLPEERSHSNP
jgi:hypothetical protein